ncbi:NADH dehydrogenase [ubiquinone] iron-sulfur protein 5 isoform X1 [Apis mellifera]|uniref:COX assembly mitochondrial protein n=1 Tax=Apis mellifera TaxID=7460 RepID=A0A7M6UD13_APIME|nr:NADH dehydrogenase [ubiquinone] iron-sulfur protein 5 [Apis mellifera]XP_026296331.1 NADH dehydrogenase [ubiquinone] iron-sulfur protein 5 isoform X1 [Apis mellifera]|eukprot:NP_001155303.1 NADH dehydrogenase [ubiquinone] iron-sulfur protein 5 [Apis mellifera]
MDNKPPKYHTFMEPLFTSPITDYFGISLHAQCYSACKDFELRLAECVEAYGFFKGQEKCEPLILDLDECLYKEKRKHRQEIISGEFQRQIDAGERKHEKAPFLFFF